MSLKDDDLKKRIAEETGYEVTSRPDFVSLEVIPEGEYDAVLFGIVNIGRQPGWKGKPPENKIKLLFEIPSFERGEEKLPTVVSKKVKLSAYIKNPNKAGGFDSGFFSLLSSLGLKVSKDTIMSYLTTEGLTSLLSKSCVVTVRHWVKDKDNIIPCAKEVSKLHPKAPQPEGKLNCFYFTPRQPNMEVFNNLTFYTKKEVMSALDADQFPKELHEAWVKVQEEQALKQAARETTKSDEREFNTEAIE